MNAHRLAEERSLAFHRHVASMLEHDPSALERARARVRAWISDGSVSRPYAEQWDRILAGPWELLRKLLVDPGEKARALRQVTPFAGYIDPRTRWRIWREVRSSFLDRP